MTSIKEALEQLLISAKILQQNAEGCAADHYGADFQQRGLPGWLRDTKANIDAAQSALASLSILATGLASDEAAIRADERERCAQIAEDDERQDEWPKSVDVNRTSPSRIMQQTIAAAIRSGGGE